MRRAPPATWTAISMTVIAGCAGFQAVNRPLDHVDPDYGYRQKNTYAMRDQGAVWLSLAFSGGGTRAAAFAYGVLEELRDTTIRAGDERVRLVDEVDAISAVSGGTFPAAYFGLFGDRVFEDFEPKFLDRNITRALLLEVLRPRNLIRLFTPFLTRSMLASRYYDRKVFDGATFADLAAHPGPHININATDLSHGYRFTFGQGQFDVICSDLGVLPVSAAVAASSAVPVLLTPITLENFAGTCGYELPDWIRESLAHRGTDLRRFQAALSFSDYVDREEKPYIHLVDGGISDNLGLRFALDASAATGSIGRVRKELGIETPRYLVLVVVNAETDPDPAIDLSAASPSFASLMGAVSGAQIRRYNLETLILVRDSLRQWAADLSRDAGHEVVPFLIEVSFDAISDEGRRRYFKRMPTSFSLKKHEVDDLREAGHRLLRDSPDFQKLLKALQ